MVTADMSRLNFYQGNTCQHSFPVSLPNNPPAIYTEDLPNVTLVSKLHLAPVNTFPL